MRIAGFGEAGRLDACSAAATAGMGVMLIDAAFPHTRRLYRQQTQWLTLNPPRRVPVTLVRKDSLCSKSTLSRILVLWIVSAAAAWATGPAFAQNTGRGSRGGRFHGGARGASLFHVGNGGSRTGGGFHGGSGRHYSGGFRGGRSLASRPRGGAYQSGRFPAGPYANSAYLGGRWAGSNGSRNRNRITNNTGGMAPAFGARFSSWASVRQSGKGTSEWHSFGTSFTRAGLAGAYSSPNVGWHSFGAQTNNVRSVTGRNFRNASVQWNSFGNAGRVPVSAATVADVRAPNMNFGSNPLRITGSDSRNWSNQGHAVWPSTSRRTFSFSPTHRPSSFGNVRFADSRFGHSPFYHSRTGSSVSLTGGSGFGGRFRTNQETFGRGTSFNADEFSFVPDLFSSLLNLGGFGLRGLGLVSSGLGRFGWDGFPWFGLGWLLSPGFASDAGPGSPYETPYVYDPGWNRDYLGYPEYPTFRYNVTDDNLPFSTAYSTRGSPSNY